MLRCDFIPHGLDKNQPGNWPSAQFLSSWFLQWGYPHSLLRRNLSTCPTVSEFKGGKQPRPFLWALYYCRKLKAQTILATLICAHTWICIKFIVSENKHGKPTEASFLFSFLLFMCLWVAKEHSYYVKKKKKNNTSIVCFWRELIIKAASFWGLKDRTIGNSKSVFWPHHLKLNSPLWDTVMVSIA